MTLTFFQKSNEAKNNNTFVSRNAGDEKKSSPEQPQKKKNIDLIKFFR